MIRRMSTHGYDRPMIYIDELRTYPRAAIKPAARRVSDTWCHMTTDGLVAELHAFAKRIGLRRAWFQPHRRLPSLSHYDLTPLRRAAALRAGASEATARERVKAALDSSKGATR